MGYSRRTHGRVDIRIRSSIQLITSAGEISTVKVWLENLCSDGAKITFPATDGPSSKVIEESSATLCVLKYKVDFHVIHAADFLEIKSLGVRFISPLTGLILDDIISSAKSESKMPKSTISFSAIINITDMSFYDTLKQQMLIFLIIDIAYQIHAELFYLENHRDVALSPPTLLYLRSESPLKGAIETTKKVVDIIKTAHDLISNREENKQIKMEEVTQEKEKSKQQLYLTSNTEDEAYIKRHTKHADVMLKHMAILESRIIIEKDELSLIREKLAFAKELFGEDSKELKLFKEKLIPHMMVLVDKTPYQIDITYNSDEESRSS